MRHSGHARDVDTETVCRPALFDLPEENDLLPDLLHRYVEILHPRIQGRQVVQFMVMRGEERLGAFAKLVDVRDDGPCDGHAVVRGGSATNLVQQHQRAVGQVVQDHRGFQHLHHEGGFSAGNIIGRTHARENLVANADARRVGRNIAANLRQQDNQRGLPQQGAFTRHVRTGEDDDLLVAGIEPDIVRNVFLARFHEGFDDGMPSALDFQHLAFIHHRPAISVRKRERRKTAQHIDPRYDVAVGLDGTDLLLHPCNQVGIDARLDFQDALFGAEDFGFVFLQFLGDVALGVHQGLLADPLRRHLVFKGVPNFDVVSEDVVESNLQRGDSGALGLPFLHGQKVAAAVARKTPKVVQFRVDSGGDHLPFSEHRGGGFGQCLADGIDQFRAVFSSLQQGVQRAATLALTAFRNRLCTGQTSRQLDQFPRRDPTGRCSRENALHVSNLAYFLLYFLK